MIKTAYISKRLALAAGVLFATATASFGADANWVTDFEKAKAMAKEQDKHLLMDFTGSDWCGWCIRLKDEVFSKDLFKEKAPEDFILVELDFPRSVEQTEELKQQNAKLRDKYGVRGYPTIILADAEGNAYAKTGYRQGGAEPYVAHLMELKKSGSAFLSALEKAKALEGEERATQLAEALGTLSKEEVLSSHRDLLNEAIKLDTDKSTGLAAEFAAPLAEAELQAKLSKLQTQGDTEGMRTAVREFIAEHNLEGKEKMAKEEIIMSIDLNEAYSEGNFDKMEKIVRDYIAAYELEGEEKANRLFVLVNINLRAKQDLEAARAVLAEMKEIAPDSQATQRAVQIIDQMAPQLESAKGVNDDS